MGTHVPLLQRGQSPQIFGPYLLWPNAWMDQDATWYGSRPQPKRHYVRLGSSSPPQKGAEPSNFQPMSIVVKRLDGSCKMPLGTEVDLSPGHIVLDGDPAPPPP